MPLKIKWVSFKEVYAHRGQRYLSGPSKVWSRALFHGESETIMVNVDPSGVPNLGVGPKQVFPRLVTQLSISLLHELGHWAGRKTHGKGVYAHSLYWDYFLEKVMEHE